MLDAFQLGNLLQITSNTESYLLINFSVHHVTGIVGYLEHFTEHKYL